MHEIFIGFIMNTKKVLYIFLRQFHSGYTLAHRVIRVTWACQRKTAELDVILHPEKETSCIKCFTCTQNVSETAGEKSVAGVKP